MLPIVPRCSRMKKAEFGEFTGGIRHFSDFCRVTRWRAKWILLPPQGLRPVLGNPGGEKSTRRWWLLSIPIREMLQPER